MTKALRDNLEKSYQEFFVQVDRREEHSPSPTTVWSDSAVFTARLSEAKMIIQDLTAAGTQVIFNQMPLSTEAENLPIHQHFIQRIKEEFHEYPFIRIDSEDFRYTDGLHPDDRSAVILTHELSMNLRLRNIL